MRTELRVRAPRPIVRVTGPDYGARWTRAPARPSPRTPLGRFPAGARVRIKVLEALWSHDPGVPFVGTEGEGERCAGVAYAEPGQR